MTKTQLLELISNKENSGVEFKRDDVSEEKLAKECVALANLKGGYVLLGVEDNGEISGLTRKSGETERWVMDAVFGRFINPPIIPFYEEIQMETGKVVGVIQLSIGVLKPYMLRHKDLEDTYIRVGSLSKIARREQIIRLAQESGLTHVEVLPVSGTSINDISRELFRDYLAKNYTEIIDIGNESILIKRLCQLDLMTTDQFGRTFCTIAGILLFGSSPGNFLSNCGIKIISYPGVEADYNASFEKNFFQGLAEMKNEQNQPLIPSILTIIIDQLAQLISKEVLIENSMERRRVWEYPFEAIRELVVNSFIHRDWTKANQNKIEIFQNRFEITSFGSLPNTLTIEKILAGQQYPRNPILVRVVRDYHFMEDRGLGIRRKVIPVLKSNGFPDPLFEATEDFVKVTIFKKAISLRNL